MDFKKTRYSSQIERLIRRQLGHVTRAKLLAAGYHRAWIRHHVELGDLIPVHAGVYAAGHVPRGAHPRAYAAVLACDPGAALSHTAALALYGLGPWPAVLEVTAPRQRRRPGITTHRSASLTHHDTRRHHGIPVTTPVRTVIDVEPRKSDAGLIRVINDARHARLLGPTALEELLTRCPRAQALIDPTQNPTRSRLEDRLPSFLRRQDLPMVDEVNVTLAEFGGREVDGVYRAARLILEVDSFRYHKDYPTVPRDRRKDTIALRHGYETVRIPETELVRGGDDEAAAIRAVLTRRAA